MNAACTSFGSTVSRAVRFDTRRLTGNGVGGTGRATRRSFGKQAADNNRETQTATFARIWNLRDTHIVDVSLATIVTRFVGVLLQ